MSDSIRELAASQYRRGTVLGLTVAEVFILLLFLLMLVFLVLWQDLRADREELDALRKERDRWQEPLAGIETPVELLNLREFEQTWRESLESAGIETPDEMVTLSELKDEMERSQGVQAPDFLRRLTVAQRERDMAVEENDRLREDLERAQEGQEETNAENAVLSNELRVLKKGQNPPCWYEVVPDGEGGERERPFYTFNIGVFDDSMVIRRLQPPPGSAEDDGANSAADETTRSVATTYADEWNRLGMTDIRYDEPLSDAELTAELQRIHDAGKQSRVRSYPCIFYVRVWDETSSGAKARWQQAHDRTLEWLFGTLRVQDEPWSASD